MISKNDIEFLINLQHELNTQDNDCNADPVFWGIMQKSEVAAYPGCGSELSIRYDGKVYHDDKDDLKELTELLLEELSEYDISDEINELITINDYCDLMTYHDLDAEIMESDIADELCTSTGAFLTKKAAKEYIQKFSYNHKKPHTYAMTAYRNFELEHLITILKDTDFGKLLKIISEEEQQNATCLDVFKGVISEKDEPVNVSVKTQ